MRTLRFYMEKMNEQLTFNVSFLEPKTDPHAQHERARNSAARKAKPSPRFAFCFFESTPLSLATKIL